MIRVNTQVATTATFIKGGERIEFIKIATNENNKVVLPLEVLFEDDYLALINKPAGILTSGNRFKTIANALPQNLRKSARANAVSPHPVHRLDYPTTGLLLVGKTSAGIVSLNKLFQDKAIVKTYVAVAIGAMNKSGSICLPIDEKEAESGYEVLQTIVSARFGFLNLVRLYPKTGRRHQLRIHLSAIGNPILGDSVYSIPGLVLKGNGLYLHAFSLNFEHPFTGDAIFMEQAPPKKFLKLFPNINFWDRS